jgi:peroxiredoxin Q/BCP
MAQLRRDYDKFVAQETEVVVVGPEGTDAFAKYWQEHRLPFVGLPDPSHSVLKIYGQKINLFKFGRMPAQVIIDKTGKACFIHYGHDMTDIPENEELLELLKSINSQPVHKITA